MDRGLAKLYGLACADAFFLFFCFLYCIIVRWFRGYNSSTCLFVHGVDFKLKCQKTVVK